MVAIRYFSHSICAAYYKVYTFQLRQGQPVTNAALLRYMYYTSGYVVLVQRFYHLYVNKTQ
jgi:hypothetical protein